MKAVMAAASAAYLQRQLASEKMQRNVISQWQKKRGDNGVKTGEMAACGGIERRG